MIVGNRYLILHRTELNKITIWDRKHQKGITNELDAMSRMIQSILVGAGFELNTAYVYEMCQNNTMNVYPMALYMNVRMD